MANIIKPKRSNTAAKVPTTSDLTSGELGVNMADKKVYINNGTSVVQVGAGVLSALGDVTITSPTTGQGLSWNGTAWVNASGAGSGDVTGPMSATDNAIVRFDGTTGKIIQNSAVTLDDTGNESGLLSEQYNTSTTPPAIVEGLEAWDSGNGTLEIGLLGGNLSYKYGQQEFARVYNGSASAMTKGQIVYIVGAQGNRVDVRLALATSDSTSAGTIGMVVDSIAAGAEGWVQVSGTVYKLNTSTLTAGQTIYLSPTTAGAYTTTKPVAPNHLVVLGFVERISATVGSIYLKVDNGYELDELHNVLITNPVNDDILIYDGTTNVWKNEPLPPSMVYPGAGIAVSTGTAWGTSKASPTGDIVGTTDSQTLTNKIFQAYSEKVETIGTISTATYNIDLSLANIFDLTLGTNVTVTFTNAPASGFTRPITLIVRQPSSSPGKTLTVTGAQYTDGTAPILSTGTSQKDVLSYWSIDGGSTYFGTYAMANVS